MYLGYAISLISDTYVLRHKMSTTSKVWKHFVLAADDPSIAVCKHCDSKISRGKCSKSYSTHPLWNHIKNRHNQITIEKQVIKTKESEDDVPRESSQSQATLTQMLQKREKMDPKSDQAQKITRAIGKQ